MNPFNPMDLNNDGNVDFSDFMLFNTFINPQPDNTPDDFFSGKDDADPFGSSGNDPFSKGW